MRRVAPSALIACIRDARTPTSEEVGDLATLIRVQSGEPELTPAVTDRYLFAARVAFGLCQRPATY